MPNFMNQKCGTVYETLTANVANVFFLLLKRIDYVNNGQLKNRFFFAIIYHIMTSQVLIIAQFDVEFLITNFAAKPIVAGMF